MAIGSYHSTNFAASGCSWTSAGMGRRMRLAHHDDLVPSCFDANSSSSIASSGVYIGMIAAGMMRSLYGRNCSAVKTL